MLPSESRLEHNQFCHHALMTALSFSRPICTRVRRQWKVMKVTNLTMSRNAAGKISIARKIPPPTNQQKLPHTSYYLPSYHIANGSSWDKLTYQLVIRQQVVHVTHLPVRVKAQKPSNRPYEIQECSCVYKCWAWNHEPPLQINIKVNQLKNGKSKLIICSLVINFGH